MKGLLLAVALASVAVLLLLLREEEYLPTPVNGAEVPAPAVVDDAPDVPRTTAEAAELPPEVAEPLTAPTPEEEPVPAKEPPPEWIDVDSLVAAGLTDQQAAELSEGLLVLHEGGSHRLWPDVKPSHKTQALMEMILMELGPRLADRISDESISVEWRPRAKPWPSPAGSVFHRVQREDVLRYTARGRVGFLSLNIPREICDPELWAEFVAAWDG